MYGKTSKLAFMGENIRNGTEHKCLLHIAEVLKFQKKKRSDIECKFITKEKTNTYMILQKYI